MPHAELLAIGTELLLGEIVDTNSATIARALRGIGLDLLYISQIGDNEERIARAIADGLERSQAIITTGGLGPTVDDVTREAAARATGRPLELNTELLAQIEERFARWGRRMTDNNRRQAMIPHGAIPIPNPVGTAPAFIVETERSAVISVPGVPKEMEYLLERAVLPYLRQRLSLTGVIKARVLRTAGLGESTAISIGGDAIIGSTYAELMPLYEADPETKVIVIYSEPGGPMDAQLADYVRESNTRLPIVAFMAGRFMDEMPGMRFGHAGTIVEGRQDTAAEKIRRLREAGIAVAEEIEQIPALVKKMMRNKEQGTGNKG